MKTTNRGRWSVSRFGRLLSGVIITGLLAGSSFMTVASAASTASGASGLSISPLRQQLRLSASEPYVIQITLKNVTSAPLIAEPIIRDFVSDNVDGNPKIITAPNYYDPASIKNFFPDLANIPLAVGQQKTFNVNIKAPANVSPGAYYGLIEFKAAPQSSANNSGNNKVALTAAVSELIFITVPGQVTQKMEVNAINIYGNTQDTSSGILFTSAPKAAGISVTNLGNSFEQPFGTVNIQNFRGKTVDSYQVNSATVRGLVLPDSSRIFINPLKHISSPGPYTVTASISYGSGSTILIAKKTFWYLPAWIIIVIIAIIILLILAVWLARRRYKRSTSGHYSH
jgi:hypothetical protein